MAHTLTPSHIATLATRAAIDDLRTLLKSLDFWNETPPTVYLFCDSAVTALIPSFAYKGKLVVKECLNAYTTLNRAAMEKLPGVKYKNLFFDFVCEKLNLLDWVFSTGDPSIAEKGVLFCDADICFLGPLFSIPRGTELAVSPHMIRVADESRYGLYNAGMIWMKLPSIVNLWREACNDSIFYEQAPIEDVVAQVSSTYEIPVTENYGWWRLWQGREPPQELQARWSHNGTGITIDGVPLGSVHTHFGETKDMATAEYNRWVLSWLKGIAKINPRTRKFLEYLGFR